MLYCPAPLTELLHTHRIIRICERQGIPLLADLAERGIARLESWRIFPHARCAAARTA
ncbi:hypothetical protein GCM10009577_18140 [Streptomyces javensis]